jgi:hypothetical protein
LLRQENQIPCGVVQRDIGEIKSASGHTPTHTHTHTHNVQVEKYRNERLIT